MTLTPENPEKWHNRYRPRETCHQPPANLFLARVREPSPYGRTRSMGLGLDRPVVAAIGH